MRTKFGSLALLLFFPLAALSQVVSGVHRGVTNDPQHEMAFTWRTDAAYVGAPTLEINSTTVTGVTYDSSYNPIGDSWYHEVVCECLAPGTEYTITPLNGTPFAASTFPSTATDVYFAAVGDQGTSANTILVANRMDSLMTALGGQFVLQAGDWSYANYDSFSPAWPPDPLGEHRPWWETWNEFVDILETIVQFRPFMLALGNHEYSEKWGSGYAGGDPNGWKEDGPLLRFKLGGNEHDYAMRYGPVAVLAVDSNDDEFSVPWNAKRLAWMNRMLARWDADPTIVWKIVVQHHPLYGVEVVQRHYDYERPILENNHVDLHLAGHLHSYHRSFPLLDGVATTAETTNYTTDHTLPNGPTQPGAPIYAIVGGGGRPLGAVAPGYTDVFAYQESRYSFLWVHADQDSLTAAAFGLAGTYFDGFTITK